MSRAEPPGEGECSNEVSRLDKSATGRSQRPEEISPVRPVRFQVFSRGVRPLDFLSSRFIGPAFALGLRISGLEQLET